MKNLPQTKIGGEDTIRYSLVGYISRLFGWGPKRRPSPRTLDEMRFSEDVREQLLQLKKKGLSIPIFTL